MDRVALTDDSEAWFDKEVATRFDGKKSKVRRNRMEVLFRTASGSWVLHTWSKASNVMNTYKQVDNERAIKWLMINEINDDEIPADLMALISDEVKVLEL